MLSQIKRGVSLLLFERSGVSAGARELQPLAACLGGYLFAPAEYVALSYRQYRRQLLVVHFGVATQELHLAAGNIEHHNPERAKVWRITQCRHWICAKAIAG